MNLRERIESGVIRIGVIDLYSNGKEEAIKPFEMRGHFNKSWEDHPDNIIKVIRNYVPNAEIHLVPNTKKGVQHLIDQECVLINVSLAGYTPSIIYDKLANKAFIVASAGNRSNHEESWLAIQNYSCAVGAVNKNLNPMHYSSYGKGVVKTVAIEPVINGKILHGTSFSSPVIIGLLAQWYIWYEKEFDCYPSIGETNNFIKLNSHDVFEDGKDLRTGYGLLRLPKKFEATEIVVKEGHKLGSKIKHVEGEPNIITEVDLLIKPRIIEGRTMIGSRGLTTELDINVHWNDDEHTSHYIK